MRRLPVARPWTKLSEDDRKLNPFTLADSGGSATITASGTAHVKGSWTELVASTAADSQFLVVVFEGTAAGNTDTRMLIDIGIGAAGSEQVLIADCGGGSVLGNFAISFGLPIFIPKGTRIAARCQAVIISDTASVAVCLWGSQVTSPAKCITLGADTANSRGTNMPTTDTYVEVSAACPQALQGFVYIPTGGGTTTAWGTETLTVTIGVGPAGSESPVASTQILLSNSEYMYLGGQMGIGTRKVVSPLNQYFPVNIPAGRRIAIKSSAGRVWHDGILLGVPSI